jgi:hypothetical protein
VDGTEDFGWDGEAGLRWLRDMNRMERMLGAFTPNLLEAAQIKPGTGSPTFTLGILSCPPEVFVGAADGHGSQPGGGQRPG